MVTTDSDGTIVKYVYGNGLISSYETKANTTEYQSYSYDLRGSVTSVSDENGSITAEYTYSTYGQRTVIEGEATVLGYCARDGVLTEANGLIYMRARYYSTELMRFINEDIITGDISNSNSLNRYAYVQGNPATMIDPFGLDPNKSGWKKASAWIKDTAGKIDNWVGENAGLIMIGTDVVLIVADIITGGALTPLVVATFAGQISGELIGAGSSALEYYVTNGTLDGASSYVMYGAAKGGAYGTFAGEICGVAYDAKKIYDAAKLSEAAGAALATYLSNPYNNEVPDSAVLRQNLIAAGEAVPEFRNAAHHIVAGGAQKAEEARAILSKYGIAINDAVNGVFLPTEHGVSEGTYHPGVHTAVYYETVNKLLSDATSKQDVIDILGYIKEGLMDGTFSY